MAHGNWHSSATDQPTRSHPGGARRPDRDDACRGPERHHQRPDHRPDHGHASRGFAHRPHRHHPDRDLGPGRPLHLPGGGARQLPASGAPRGLSAEGAERHARRRGDRHAGLRDDARAGAARRDRHHGHRRAAQARDRQRGLDHRRPGGRQAVADHRVHQPDLGPRAGRPGAQERRHHRHRDAHPDPRVEQRLALQRAAVLHRRRPGRELSLFDHAGYRRVRGHRPLQPVAVTHQRPQSGRHRQHRDREGAGGGHALRHSGVERRRADHDQAWQPRSRAVEPVQRAGRGDRPQHLSAQLQRTRLQQPGLRRLLHSAVRAGRGLHPDLGGRVLAAREQGHPSVQGRVSPAARDQRVGRERHRYLLPVSRVRERGRGLPAAQVRGGFDPRPLWRGAARLKSARTRSSG